MSLLFEKGPELTSRHNISWERIRSRIFSRGQLEQCPDVSRPEIQNSSSPTYATRLCESQRNARGGLVIVVVVVVVVGTITKPIDRHRLRGATLGFRMGNPQPTHKPSSRQEFFNQSRWTKVISAPLRATSLSLSLVTIFSRLHTPLESTRLLVSTVVPNSPHPWSVFNLEREVYNERRETRETIYRV